MTLAALARRADTSVPTVSRYENGWTRFEVYTLKKLATVLGCRLEISLVPLPDHSNKPSRLNQFVRRVNRLFWDRPIEKDDIKNHIAWVIKRILEYGNLDDVKSLINIIGKNRFLGEVADIHFDSPRTAAFWRLMLKKEGKIPCTRRFSRKAAESCWRH